MPPASRQVERGGGPGSFCIMAASPARRAAPATYAACGVGGRGGVLRASRFGLELM